MITYKISLILNSRSKVNRIQSERSAGCHFSVAPPVASGQHSIALLTISEIDLTDFQKTARSRFLSYKITSSKKQNICKKMEFKHIGKWIKNTVIYNVCDWSEVEKVPWKTVTINFNLKFYTFTMQCFQNFSHGLKVHWIFFSILVWFWFSFFSSGRKIELKNVRHIENSSYCWHFFLKPFALGNKKNQTIKNIKQISHQKA